VSFIGITCFFTEDTSKSGQPVEKLDALHCRHLKGKTKPEMYFRLCLTADAARGERGIRTPGTQKGTTVFETAPIDHSGISPWSAKIRKKQILIRPGNIIVYFDANLGHE
jgi:hypothetical protein